jgi:hypothetical protein
VAIYPFYAAGQRLTAADLQAGQFIIVRKTVNTDRVSTTTLADDPELTFSLAANATYIIEFYLFFAGNLGKLATQWTVPSGVTGNRSALGPGSNALAGTSGNMDNISGRFGVHGYGTTVVYGGRTVDTATPSLNQEIAVETSLISTSSAGTCAIKWAQNASNTNATRMAQGSWARALRIA